VKHCGPQIVSDLVQLVGFGDCREAQDLPRLLLERVTFGAGNLRAAVLSTAARS
jgi:hypothetical protein